MKHLILSVSLVLSAVMAVQLMEEHTKSSIHAKVFTKIDGLPNKKLENAILSTKKLLKDKPSYNSEIGFFIDMSIMSGKNRFFVYDFKQKKVIDKGLVAHGSGSETDVEGKLKFSNKPGSYCTSLGRYSIGDHYEGKFGKSYKLYGLDKSNSKALKRHVVMHKYADVPYWEQDEPICNSLGCPMVNEKFYARLEKIIDNSKKEIILNIYY